MRYPLRPEQRLRGKNLFQTAFKKGKAVKGDFLKVWIYGTGTEEKTRAGIMVSRKIDTRAVKRNVWKRRIREAFRLMQHEIPAGGIILVQATRPGPAPAFVRIKEELEKLLKPKKTI